ncbi:MAG: hypothetical protein ACUVQG_13865 [Thermogutta sp.]
MTSLLIAVGWTDPSVWLVLAAIVLIWFSLFRSQRRWGRGSSPRLDDDVSSDARLKMPAGRGLPDAASQLEVKLHELAREIEGRLNSKLGLLEQLIRDADRAAARLETALRTAEHLRRTQIAGILPSLPPRGTASVPGATEDPTSEHRTNDLPPEDRGDRFEEAGQQGTTADSSADRAIRLSSEKGQVRRSIEEIYTLADYGYSVEEIAQRTATPSGEVQLILSLRKSRPASAGD